MEDITYHPVEILKRFINLGKKISKDDIDMDYNQLLDYISINLELIDLLLGNKNNTDMLLKNQKKINNLIINNIHFDMNVVDFLKTSEQVCIDMWVKNLFMIDQLFIDQMNNNYF